MARTGERDDSASPLQAASKTASSRATEAFAVLGNETRLAILLALWEAYEPWTGENAVPFTELRNRVGISQGGEFTYHLDQLVGRFVRKTDAGYELRRAGHQVVRTVIAGAGFENLTLAPTEIDHACHLCGAPTAVTYQDEYLFWVCTECEGLFGNRDYRPKRMLAGYPLNPAGVTDRRPEELLHAAFVGGAWGLQSAIEGVCIKCSGPVEGWLHRCDDHASGGICSNCGRQNAVTARFRCSVCKHNITMVPWWLVKHHPAVVAFYYDRGVPLQYERNDSEQFLPRRELHLEARHDQQIVSEDPLRVRVTIRYDGDELALTLDGDVNVVDVTERA